MLTSTKLDKYKPNTRKKLIVRQTKSVERHCTVYAHAISNGINRKVTIKSAMAFDIERQSAIWSNAARCGRCAVIKVDSSSSSQPMKQLVSENSGTGE